VTFGYRHGWDNVYRDIKVDGIIENDPTFHERADHRGYSLSVSQIVTRNAILDLNFEAITDEGYLQSPYREVRYLDPTKASGFSLAPQVTPNTRTSTAASADLKYYLPYRAAVTAEYRYYTDTWGINGNTFQVSYTQPWRHFIFDGSLRYYLQNAANFYSDLFPRLDYSNFEARDRELAAFHSISLGFGAAYEFHVPYATWINKSSLNFHFNHLMINYSDFRNACYSQACFGSNAVAGYTPQTDPLYKLDANIFQLFVSIWF